MQRDIRHTWFLQSPPETVWDYLTIPELLAQWLMESDFQPVVGHKFMFNTKPKVKLGFDGMIYCEVLEVNPIKKLVYSWKGGPGKGKITLDSVVTWTLVPKDNGTELQLVHAGFTGVKNYISYLIMNKGWEKIIKRLTHHARQVS
jgi:uncharacterized protein YndB with AHSA1/START domain